MIYVYFSIYFIIINLIGFLLMYIDKTKAKKHDYRISEKTLFAIAFVLGATGVYIGMYKFRHKTKHKLFTIGIPVLIIFNIYITYYIISHNILNLFFNYILNL